MGKSTTGAKRPGQLARAQAPQSAIEPARGVAFAIAIGFACGAVFWHALGFAGIHVEAPADPKGEAAYALADVGGPSPLETGSLPTIYRVNPAACTSLELDRQSNRTVERPCPAGGLALRLDGSDNREDLAAILDGDQTR